MLARRGVPAPSTRASGAIAAMPASRRSRSAPTRGRQPVSAAASSQARPKPTMPARFSVPGRQRRSCPPPWCSAAGSIPGPSTSAPTPGGPAQLVRRQRHKVGAQLLDIDRDFPGRLHRIAVHQGVVAAGAGDHIAHWLQHAGLVVRQHHRDQRRAEAFQLFFKSLQVDHAVRVDRDPARHPAPLRGPSRARSPRPA